MKISIITVSFNAAHSIADTFASVAEQTYSNIEHIVVDGASTDGTLDIIERHRANIAKIISEPDCGIYDAMNKGLRLVTGDIVGFINSDDFYASPEVLARVAEVFADEHVDACYGDLCYVEQENVAKVMRYWRSSAFEPGLFSTGWVPPHPTLYLRRRVLERHGTFDLHYRIAADFELMARLIEVHRIKTVYIPQVLVKMRLGGTTNRSWSNILKQNREIWHALGALHLRPSLASFLFGKLLLRGRQFFAKPA